MGKNKKNITISWLKKNGRTVEINRVAKKVPVYKSLMFQSTLLGLAGVLLVLFFSFYFALTPLNIHSIKLWLTLFFALIVFTVLKSAVVSAGCKGYERQMATDKLSWREVCKKQLRFYIKFPCILFVVFLIVFLSGTPIFNAHRHASILTVEDAVFAEDLSAALNNDSIALMDTASARMLGDREIGSLSHVVSQYDVSDDYIQIDFQGKPKKVAALDYAGFFKWIGNKNQGAPGYVTVDPVSMSATYNECENGMIYVPSAFFSQDAARYIRFNYPTLLLDNLHFEIDEEGHPYYICSILKKTISLFGGKTVDGAIILDPVSGELTRYDLTEVPTWADVIFDGNLICKQYNWYGQLQNGFINSIFGKKGCKRVTTYTSKDDEEDEDAVPVSDYGYVAKDGDIWIYTGITSVNGDSSNIGFLLSNERTGESHYYSIAGADEKSAMAAAEGEVQEKRYQASFPSLINVDGHPTYIMVLKDASGLVKLYATVNVEQYNLVTTAVTQADCMEKYKRLLGINNNSPIENTPDADDEPVTANAEATILIQDIKYIDINGNTYIYLISDNEEIYKAMAASHENMLLLKAGDTVHLTCADQEIITCEKQ